MNYLELANLLDNAAKALRQAHLAMETIKPQEETPITRKDIGARSFNRLRHVGITTVEGLVQQTEEDLLDLKNIGMTSIRVIRDFLAAKGLKLKGDP